MEEKHGLTGYSIKMANERAVEILQKVNRLEQIHKFSVDNVISEEVAEKEINMLRRDIERDYEFLQGYLTP